MILIRSTIFLAESTLVSKQFPNYTMKRKEGVLRQLQNIEFFSATSDMSFTVHFIDSDWKLQSRCLQTLYVPEDHTAKILAEGMKEQVCLTTDSGANIVKAAHDLAWPCISCFGHNLQLAMTNAMKDEPRISRAVGICKRIVFSQSWKRRRDLSKAQLELKLPVKSIVSVSNLNEIF